MPYSLIPMRILVYSQNFAPELTGTGKYAGEMAIWLAENGCDVRVITSMPYYPSWKIPEPYSRRIFFREDLNGVDIWRSTLYVPKTLSLFKRLLHLLSFTVTSVPNLLSQIFWRPQVIFVVEPSLFCAPGALLIGFLSRSKTWLHVQDFEIDAMLGLKISKAAWVSPIAIRLEAWLMNGFDRVSTISLKMLEKLSLKGVSAAKTVYFPNWADIKQPSNSAVSNDGNKSSGEYSFRADWGVGESDYILLYSGNMGEKQGLETLVNVARLLVDQGNIKFVLCGEGVTLPRLKKLGGDLKNIIWLPLQPKERLSDLLRSADIHLLPQKSGIDDLVLPSKLIGMMSSGRPIVACANDGTELANIVKNCGLVVPPENADTLYVAILKLLKNEDLRRELGNFGRKYVEDNLNAENILKKFQRELEELIKS